MGGSLLGIYPPAIILHRLEVSWQPCLAMFSVMVQSQASVHAEEHKCTSGRRSLRIAFHFTASDTAHPLS